MDTRILNQAIYDKYIRPTKRPKQPFVGVEFELPIVNLKKEPVDFRLVHEMTEAFGKEFGFTVQGRDDDGFVNSMASEVNGDDLSFDCSYNTLEFSFGVERDLNELNRRFRAYYTFVREKLQAEDHTLTGMGINPYHQYNRNVPIPNGRYRMLFHHLSSYRKYSDRMRFHDIPNFGLISCASQIHLDVEEDEIVRTINAFYRLEPLKALIFANSPLGEDLLCSRDHLWKKSLHGLNPHNVDGFAKELRSVDEVVAYYRSMSLYCLERDGKYINFEPTPLIEYFNRDRIFGEYFNGEEYENIVFEPRIEDLEYLRSFKFEDLTYRGTIEFRSVCEQPAGEIFAAPAFHAGLKENLDELEQVLADDRGIYQQSYSVDELREMFVRRDLPDFLDKRKTSQTLMRILEIAEDGLRKRGQNEEHFLAPLYARAEKLLSPAREMVEGIEQNKTLEYYIEKFSELDAGSVQRSMNLYGSGTARSRYNA